VLAVILLRRLGGARLARLHGRVDHRILVFQMAAAEGQQQLDAIQGLGQVRLVVGIDPPEAGQGLAHEGPQALVNADVHVVAGRAEGGGGAQEAHGRVSLSV